MRPEARRTGGRGMQVEIGTTSRKCGRRGMRAQSKSVKVLANRSSVAGQSSVGKEAVPDEGAEQGASGPRGARSERKAKGRDVERTWPRARRKRGRAMQQRPAESKKKKEVSPESKPICASTRDAALLSNPKRSLLVVRLVWRAVRRETKSQARAFRLN